MKNNLLFKKNVVNTKKALALFLHSSNKLVPIDPGRVYSMDDLEPYDAMVSRFERAVELVVN